MLPTPVVTANAPLMVDINKKSLSEIKIAFMAAVQPLIKAITTVKDAVAASLGPDPEESTDRGKDLQEKTAESQTMDDPEFGDQKGGVSSATKIIAAAVATLATALIFFKDETMAIINSVNFPAIVKALGVAFKVVTAPLKLLINAFTFSAKVFGKIGPTFSKIIGTVVGVFTKLFGFIGGVVKGIMALLGPFGAVLAKLFLPVTIIMGVIDGIKGFVEGFKDGGLLDGIFTGIGSILGGLVGLPLDFLKNIFAFILEKLGFEQVAEAMKEFSFKEMILNVFGGIADFFKSIPGIIAKVAEKVLRAVPIIGDTLADKFFGKDKEVEIKKREKIQEESQEVIDKNEDKLRELEERKAAAQAKKTQDSYAGKPGKVEKQIDKQIAKTQREIIQAKDKQSTAAMENLALKTGGAKGEENLTKKEFYARLGAGKITSVEDAEYELGRPLTKKEGEFLKSKIDSERKVKDDLANLEFAEDLEAEVLEKKKPRRFKFGREDAFAADVARAKMGVDLDAPGTTQVKMVEGKVVEGKALDEVGDPKGSFGVNAPQDNSQTTNDNSQTNNNTTHNHYGGDSDGGNSTNPDGTLFGATKYASEGF